MGNTKGRGAFCQGRFATELAMVRSAGLKDIVGSGDAAAVAAAGAFGHPYHQPARAGQPEKNGSVME